ncbi:hypothetical protein TREMEDRAFT_33081 [Tremella mesenterica DSM 1558]|uniref:uncharacterized protein n=1 Tax=Tremella mesenterica (strain ATCC 24925 / CBS 8224 / DSM 1558 / NBRC 9311 / NRRL Y-6157 / RJB 2259-6 / UBC 559-6) TaxID=578456 RepID=UPI0003F49B35|nr:uncharacterized protein TREMEDRAFT_33081 [Tremella mesenterica DSM 1558]EIW67873.1 hypothetical protein TREMEDRAFT_33081 [Tremella mesenterica DSM 1558]
MASFSKFKDNEADIEVTWDGPDDPACPMNWCSGKKLKCLILYGSSTMCATFTSSIFSSSAGFVARDYHISEEVALLGLSLFILGFSLGPIFFGPVSEVYGRKLAIVPPLFIFICFSAATATAQDLQTIFITRFFAGVFGSAPVTIVGGGLADIYNQRQRGSAIVVYSLCIVGGPTVAPIIGIAVSQALSWRWTAYIPVILTSIITSLDFFFLPETSHASILTEKARRIRLRTKRWGLHSAHEEKDLSLKNFFHKMLIIPLKMWITVKGRLVSMLTIRYGGFAYGILYMLFAAVPIIYGQQRGWKPVPTTLPILGVLIGTLVAAAINWIYSEKYFARYLDTHGGKAPPERRLPPMMIGAVAFPIGFFLTGWTSQSSVHWFPSVLGLGFVGMSFLLILQSGMNYLIDAYTSHAASAVAAYTFSRSILGAAMPLIASPLLNNLGTQWACTLLGCLAILLGITPFLFYRYGSYLRSISRFAPHKS